MGAPVGDAGHPPPRHPKRLRKPNSARRATQSANRSPLPVHQARSLRRRPGSKAAVEAPSLVPETTDGRGAAPLSLGNNDVFCEEAKHGFLPPLTPIAGEG